MPGLRYGLDITDQAAIRTRELDNLTERISRAASDRTKAKLENQREGLLRETVGIFGDERSARLLASYARFDGGRVDLSDGTSARTRPPLSAAAKRAAERAGSVQIFDGESNTSKWTAGRTARPSANNPIGREGGPRLAAEIAEAQRRRDNAGRARRRAEQKAKKAEQPRRPRGGASA